ncbi:diaminopimelate epimerase [Stakelama pacifica]|uniref:Diaminopimelate epimerase n=1 Tax=Stakelama pacifica TaxID=517720 RepID=A0A4R6FWM8_9SPHN|nr:diaminopimelate epimerase [Stakelama pacifica]TDN85385.1 diaminopimelate epimerase [Stakelama pacifica]GGO92807.1 diaminopimelate epimerase [Stakelama pacifica]
MQISFIKCHGSGNDFPLVDARALTLSDEEWANVARLLANREGPVGGDGLLLLTPGDAAHDFGMRMFNSDGSEAETCLNGLRCTARLGFELTGLNEARVKLKTSSATARRCEAIADGVVTIETRAGPASTDPADVGVKVDAPVVDSQIPGLPSERRFTGVAMPNPHLVTFVDAVDEAELVALGDWCEAGPDLIPARANVSFVVAEPQGLFVRTYERGVGLTDSCGSAMAASAFAAGLTGRKEFGTAVMIRNRGGMVVAEAQAPESGGLVSIRGNATFTYDAGIEIDPAAGRLGELVVHNRRFDEAKAWGALVASLD